jgi:hypothetical protein
MSQRLFAHAYLTYTVRYDAQLYHKLQLGHVSIALSSSLQSLPIGDGKPGIAPAGYNTCGIASLWVASLHTATPSASLPAKASTKYGSPTQHCSIYVTLWTMSSL